MAFAVTRPSQTGTIMLGLSGGVDSSVAALLLLEQGYDVEGLFMKNWEEDDDGAYCAAAKDLADAQAVADRLGIRLHRANFSADYWDRVFARFLAEYRAGRTPNPDVLCNKEIKFGAFLDHAARLGASLIATGHYARIRRTPDGPSLRLAADESKDQTYFLYLLDRHQLARSLFPLGKVNKGQVRAIARRAGLPTAEKRDSTGICFIGERRFRDFLARYVPGEPGPIETIDGTYLGHHQGLAYYTIGQRQGLGIGGIAGSAECPWYVAEKDSTRNTLIVVQGHEHPLLMRHAVITTGSHWIAGGPPRRPPFRCKVRLRHRQALQSCVLERIDGERCMLRFERPQRAVTPGQAAVFYLGDECLGGGTVEQVEQ
jgi:tRNA-specific 2-thiouridylase